MEPSNSCVEGRCGVCTKGGALKAVLPGGAAPLAHFLVNHDGRHLQGSLQQAGLSAHFYVSFWARGALAHGSPWAGLASSQESVLGARRIRHSANSSRTFVRLREPPGEPEGVLVSMMPGEAGGSVGVRVRFWPPGGGQTPTDSPQARCLLSHLQRSFSPYRILVRENEVTLKKAPRGGKDNIPR